MSRAVNREALFASACAGIFVFGIVLALLGTLFGLPGMRERLGIDLAGQGDVFLVMFAGIFTATAIVGPVIDRIGSKWVLAASSLLVAAAMLVFLAARHFAGAASAAFMLGLGGGGLNTTANVLVSDLFDESRAARLNVLGTFFGVGALCIPLAAAALAAWLSITQLLVAASALALLVMLLYVAIGFPPPREREGFSWADAARVVRYPGVLMFGVLLLFQSGSEAAIGGWTSTYIGSLGWTSQTATWVLAGYWAGLMAGRVVSARVPAHWSKPLVLLGSGLGSIAGCALLLSASSLATVTAGVALLGLSYANVFPVTLAMVGDRYSRFTGTVFGLLFSIALVGGMLFPWVVGQVSQRLGVRAGMIVPLVGAVSICALAWRLYRRR
jgi:fucose permease